MRPRSIVRTSRVRVYALVGVYPSCVFTSPCGAKADRRSTFRDNYVRYERTFLEVFFESFYQCGRKKMSLILAQNKGVRQV